MARVTLNDGQSLYAFNDLFIGIRNHTSARYTLQFDHTQERQSSSGIIVSTPAGSTGWLSSVFNMSRGVAHFLGDSADIAAAPLSWEDRQLVFIVREPFRSKWSGADIVAGRILEGHELRIESHMPEGGIIFSDGVEADHLEFNSGATAQVSLADKATELVVA
ncbi:MAG: hypothetical protein HY042_10085 [Spirochaetia bacterium]|nr:hypothetical protein [Spirochaetia bacterium]